MLAECCTRGRMPKAKKGAEAAEINDDTAEGGEEQEAPPVDENKGRGTWAKESEFFLTVLGYAVGLANVWRFPYICMKNGGGVFLIPYLLSMLLAAIPLQFLEMGIGQFSSLSALKVWEVCPLFTGIGWGMFIICYIVCAYYSLVMIWTVYFAGMSFQNPLPWSHCNNTWNTENCSESRRGHIFNVTSNYTGNWTYSELQNQSTSPFNSSYELTSNLTSSTKFSSPAEEFFKFNVLDISDGIDDLGGLRWQPVVCHFIVWLFVGLSIIKGVKSTGKVVYVTATAPYIFLTILLIRGCTLPGSLQGIIYYLKPDFSKLLTYSIWSDACLQVFFSTGPGWGGVITMASYNKFRHNICRTAILVPILNAATSLYAGFAVFSVVGYMAYEEGVPVDEAISSGPSLAFIVYPEALTKLPYPPVWSVLFFVMLFTLGLDTQFMLEETIVSGIRDTWPSFLKRDTAAVTTLVVTSHILVGLVFCTQGGMYLFQVIDWYACAFAVIIFSAMESLVISYIYGFKRFFYDLEMMIGFRPCWGWRLLWGFTTPVALLACAINFAVNFHPPKYGDYEYPDWTRGMGWTIATIPFLPIPAFFIYRLVKAKGTLLQRLKSSAKPSTHWGPALDDDRRMYKYTYQDDIAMKDQQQEQNGLVVTFL